MEDELKTSSDDAESHLKDNDTETKKTKKKLSIPDDILHPPSNETKKQEDVFPDVFDTLKESSSDTGISSDENEDEDETQEKRRVSFQSDYTNKTDASQLSDISEVQTSHKTSEKSFPENKRRIKQENNNLESTPVSADTPSSQAQDDNNDILKESSEEEDSKDGSLDFDKPIEDTRRRRNPQRRPSFVRRKILNLEKELTLDKINEKITRIFTPDFGKKHSIESEEKNDNKPQRTNLSATMATIFIISVTTGSGILSLPYYLKQSNWFGVFLIIVVGLNSLYAGICLGWCWIIMEEMWPEYSEYSRIPYQDIGYRAVGIVMKYIVAVLVDVSVLGTCGIYIILIADSIETISFGSIQFCILLVIVTVFLLPFTMFGSYGNMKFVGISDVVLSILFSFFLLISFFMDNSGNEASAYKDPDFIKVVQAFSGFSFSFGSGPLLPSILVDMKDRTLFTHSCSTAYLFVLVIYVVLAVMGYAAYADNTPPYILQIILMNEKYHLMGVFLGIIYILQLMTTFICFLKPSLHAFEERVNCPDRFCLGRVAVRGIIVVFLLLLTLGVPYMSRYLELVGATTLNLLTFIFPPLFYVCLVWKQSQNSRRRISKKEYIFIVETVAIGIAVAITSTITRLQVVKTSEGALTSCYFNMTEMTSWVSMRKM